MKNEPRGCRKTASFHAQTQRTPAEFQSTFLAFFKKEFPIFAALKTMFNKILYRMALKV